MTRKTIISGLMAASLAGSLLTPIAASAQDHRDHSDNRSDHHTVTLWDDNRRDDWLAHHRRDTKNEWRNIAIGAGALGALGLLENDDTLAILGGAGALYSLNRYEHDRKSEDRADRLRAKYFSHKHFYRDGVRYDRQLVHRNGERYYQFVERH